MNKRKSNELNDMRTLRNASNLTIAGLSELTGLCTPTISNLENGKQSPHESTKAVIESYLGRVDWEQTRSLNILSARGRRRYVHS